MRKCLREISASLASDLRLSKPLKNGFYFVGLIDERNEIQEVKATFLGLSDKSHTLAKEYMSLIKYPLYSLHDWRMSFNDNWFTETICDEKGVFDLKVKINKRRAKERVRERKNTARLNWLYKNRELIVPVGLFLIMGIMYLFVLGVEAIL